MYNKLMLYFGSKAKLAEALGISPVSLQHWKNIPPLRAYEIESLTKGEFKFKSLIKINFQENIKKRNKK